MVNTKEQYQKLLVSPIERFDQMSVERRPMKPPFLLVSGAFCMTESAESYCMGCGNVI